MGPALSASPCLRVTASILREPGLDEDAAPAFQVPLQVGKACLPARADVSPVSLVGGAGVRNELLDRHEAALPQIGEGQDHAQPFQGLALTRLDRHLAHDEAATALEFCDLAEDRRLRTPAAIRETDCPVASRTQPDQGPFAPPGKQVRHACEGVE